MADRPALSRRALTEGIGTFALVFAGCGAIVTNADRHGALGVVGVGLVFFLVLLAAIATLGHVSGAHFNPGVSLSFFLTRHLPARDLGAYWTAQFAGATLAALLLLVIWPARAADLGATIPSIPVGRALIIGMVLTALLMLVIVSVATDTRAVGAPAVLAIAAAVGLAAIAFGPLTGASLNTARSFGPAPASGQWQDFRRRAAARRSARSAHLRVRPRKAEAASPRPRRERGARWRPPCSSACITPGAHR